MKPTSRLITVATWMLSLPALASPVLAGVIDDALNLPGMEEIKAAVGKGDVTVSFKDLPKDELAEQDEKNLYLNSKALGESDDPGVIAQEIMHEYWHFKLKHDCDCKENEVPVRKKEAAFWRNYKATHPGHPAVPNQACDKNEEAVYSNGQFRSDAAIQKKCRAYGYPDEKDAKQRSHCRYDLTCPTSSTCTLSQVSCQTTLTLNGTVTVTPTSSAATIAVSPPDANNVSRFTVTSYTASAPSVTVAGFGASGANSVSLDPSTQSFGYIDRTTNKVTFYLYSQLVNSVFPQTNPIHVATHAQGMFTPGSGGGGQLTLDTLAIDDVPLATTSGVAGTSSIPTVSEWGMVILVALLISAGVVLARKSRPHSRPS